MFEYKVINYDLTDEHFTVFMAEDESFVTIPELFGDTRFATMLEAQTTANELFAEWDKEILAEREALSYLFSRWD